MGVAARVVEPAHLRLHSIEDDGDKDSVILGLAPGPRQEVHLRAVVVLYVVHLGIANGGVHPQHCSFTMSLVESQTFFLTSAIRE